MGMLQLLLLHPVRTLQMHLISSSTVTPCANSWDIDSKDNQPRKDNQEERNAPLISQRTWKRRRGRNGKIQHLCRVSKLLSASSGLLKSTIFLISRNLQEEPPSSEKQVLLLPIIIIFGEERRSAQPSGS